MSIGDHPKYLAIGYLLNQNMLKTDDTLKSIIYDKDIISFKELLNIFWKNIDPFDPYGQFCDKGKSYRSVIFYKNNSQKKVIQKSIAEIEQRFNSKVVTLLWKFDRFYQAEDYHQDYYQKNFLRYLAYKKACQREEVLNKIWN